jgi:hypothetical protein
MQSSRNDIHMFCSIQTHRYIGTSSMKFHINHQTHIHIGTCSHKTCHTSSSCYACLSFVSHSFVVDADGTSTQSILHLSCRWDFNPNGLMFSVHDFISMLCIRAIIIIYMLSHIYASFTFICYSFSFQTYHENIDPS